MAVNAYTLDHATYQPYVRHNADGGLVDLGFGLFSVDTNDQFWLIAGFQRVSPTGEHLLAKIVQPEVVKRANLAFPRASRGQDQDKTGVFQYGGV